MFRGRSISTFVAVLMLTSFASIWMRAMSGQVPPAPPLLPNGIAYDAAGNLYFADTNRHQVYESSLAGLLSVVAGTGVQGSSGDALDSPEGVAVGADGTVYVADTGNHRIRVLVGGRMVAFAGTGRPGFGGDGGAATAAALNRPGALALDNTGALLVCDSLNHRVRRISGGTITTIAGSGTQGFAGDGGAATAAELDTPSGVAVGSDGRVYVADTHNNRIRVIADGTITTFAGTGLAGFSGEGGAATAARLAFPRGLYVTAGGAVLVTDSNNQRLRMIDTTGTISTLAGSGVQGRSQDASVGGVAALDTPRSVALSTFGAAVFSDARNQAVRERMVSGILYLPAGLASGRKTTVSLTQSPGADVMVAVAGAAGTPQGAVILLEGTATVAQGTLVAGSATLTPSGLDVGPHTLTAMYAGDGVNPAASSDGLTVTVSELVVVATADAVVVGYGAPIPVLTGSFTGVLPGDDGEVAVVFRSVAAELDPPGTYPITASLTGSASAKYAVVLHAGSGSVEIDRAATLTAEQPLTQNSYAGLPLVLTAGVVSTTQGTPSGVVTFSEGASVVGAGTLTDGVASATFLAPSAGSHSITASYGGDADFGVSAAQAVRTVVGAMPDFTVVVSGAATQTVSAGAVVSYGISVGAEPSPFTGAVTLSESGTPAGWTVTFSPPQTVPGAGAAAVTMSVQTAASVARSSGGELSGVFAAWLLVPLGLVVRWKRRLKQTVLLGTVLLLGGCGARSVTTKAIEKQTYSLHVTGTATNLAGVVVTHSATVTLIVQ